MVEQPAEIPLAAGRPMRARTKGNWGGGARVRRLTPWTAAAASNLVRTIDDQLVQAAGEMAAGMAEIASATVAFPQAAVQGEEGLLVVAPVDRAEPAQEQVVRVAHPAWGPAAVGGVAVVADEGSAFHR